MIDNIELIKPLLTFENEDQFYFAQILKRKKEHPELGSNSYVVKTYFIKSLKDLNFYLPEIKCLCDFHNARAYINLNKRSFETMAFQNLKKISDQILNRDFKSVRKSYNSVCGMYAKDSDKKWIVDLDGTDLFYKESIYKFVNLCEPKVDGVNKVIAEIPTKNGIHLITSPFNVKQFKELCNEIFICIEVHKNNPTILYLP